MSAQPVNKQIRVLVVDDSAFMRFTISKHLNEFPDIQVVGTAADGKEALELIPRLEPDVITLDVEMPKLDGLSTLSEIMKRFPRPVIMISSLTSEGTLETVRALTFGAVDFIAKPSFKANVASIMLEVAEKVRKASKAKVWSMQRPSSIEPVVTAKIGTRNVRPLRKEEKIVVIGSSTGGPRALSQVMSNLPEGLPAAFVIVQHMPAGFTRSLAERLNSLSPVEVKEAEPGDTLDTGRCLVAPGGFHMQLDANDMITLNQNPPVHGVRPSVDVTLLSIAQKYKDRVISVILTGMGSDGTTGASLVHASGGWVIAEAEESCVVWGMPRSVVEAGAADQIEPLGNIHRAIADSLRR